MDLYWQFAAWAKQPLMISNFTALLLYGVLLAIIYDLWKDLRAMRASLSKIIGYLNVEIKKN